MKAYLAVIGIVLLVISLYMGGGAPEDWGSAFQLLVAGFGCFFIVDFLWSIRPWKHPR